MSTCLTSAPTLALGGGSTEKSVDSDNARLWDLTNNRIICVIYDIDDLSLLAHNWDMNNLARDPKQIGNIIRRARKQRALSQKELGDRTGLRQETISLIENGNAAAKIETLLAVLAALDLEFQIAARSKGVRDGQSYF